MPFKHKFTPIEKKLSALVLISVLVVVILFGVDFYQRAKQKEGLSESQLLKADKEDIIDYEIQSGDSVNAGELGANDQGIVVYTYVTTKEAPAETYQGLKEDLSKRTANSQTFLKSIKPIDDQTQQEEYVAKFYTAPTFQRKGDKWYQVETAVTTNAAFFRQTKLTLLDHVKTLFGQNVLADTFYSGAGDGYVTESDNTWSVAQAAATGTSVDYALSVAKATSLEQAGPFIINRAFLPFGTSAIPTSATIISASLNVNVVTSTDPNNDGHDYINVVQTSQVNSASLVTSDYNKAGVTTTPSTGSTNRDLTGLATGALSFTLNTTGISWITKSGETSNCGTTAGVTCLGIREGHDMDNTAAGPLNGDSGIAFNTSDSIGTTQDPYLTVTYITTVAALRLNGGKLKLNGGRIKVNSN